MGTGQPWRKPNLLSVEEIKRRLEAIFSPGIENRDRCTCLAAARAVFVALYGGAVQSEERWFRPDAVTKMSSQRAKAASSTPVEDRFRWLDDANKGRAAEGEVPWYEPNTREVIRDEALSSLRSYGAVVERSGLAVHSPKPRWALADDFAKLFDPDLTGEHLDKAIEGWRGAHLSQEERMRIELLRRSAGESLLVTAPGGSTVTLRQGPSSKLVKTVIEHFAWRFLKQPALVWVGDSLHQNDRTQMQAQAENSGLRFMEKLPDVVLFDLDSKLLVFVECDVTGGPVTSQRRRELMDCAPGFQRVAFVTTFLSRDHEQYRRDAGRIAWGTFVWFMADPGRLVYLMDDRGEVQGPSLYDLLSWGNQVT